jgi:hypothetical protein
VRYINKVLYDVFPMLESHILFGRP